VIHLGLEASARPSATGKERVRSLDGVRAVAVLVTMGFHFGVGWLQGGFFGLDIFFVLSGFLITGLLVGEFRRDGHIRLLAFWARRARRLLPALVIVLVAVTLMVRFAEPAGLYTDFRMDALSALFYFSNWFQIAASSNYFVATGASSPLTHTWSLAVEEQFYLVWPFVVLAVMFLARGFIRGVRALLVVAAVGAVASAVEMAFLYSPTANTTRLYFGTDTHAESILVGAALACALTLVASRRGEVGMAPHARGRAASTVLAGVGVVGLVATVVLSTTLDGYSPFVDQGGILLSAVSAGALILSAVTVPTGPVARLLAVRPMVWIGTISYGAYLWHYPIDIFVDPARVGFGGGALLALRFGLTFAVAAASYMLVERPVMERTFWRSLQGLGGSLVAVGATVVVIVAGTTVVAAGATPVVVRYRPPTTVHPVAEVLVLGDSTALTLGYALSATAPVGTRVVNAALFGCGLTIGNYISGDPPTPQLPFGPQCNAAQPVDQQWPAVDTKAVQSTGPGDVVLFVAGTWETLDTLRDGRWTSIREPSFQSYLRGQMRTAVRIGTSRGAHFDFTEMPANHTIAGPNDSATRRLIYDRLITEVAAEFPHKASVINYGKILTPKGVFTEYLDGVQIRTIDGVHTPSYAAGNDFVTNSTPAVANAFYRWISPRLWPLILTTGRGP
jgi:peptidoglycan/LPS O-acetylase OafA/YrhL